MATRPDFRGRVPVAVVSLATLLLALPATLLATLLATVQGAAAVSAEGATSASSASATRVPTDVSASVPPYRATISRIGPDLAAWMTGSSYHAGCPVPLSDLRQLRMSFWGFDGEPHTGRMVVREPQAVRVTQVFHTLYDARFPIRRMRLVDAYDGSDTRSMNANNTSAFNCRKIAGTNRWSEHSYGRAIDINPIQNPYVQGSFVAPSAGRPYAWIDRSPDARYRKGVIRSRDVVVRAFKAVYWSWGGYWTSVKDYQHFSRTGR